MLFPELCSLDHSQWNGQYILIKWFKSAVVNVLDIIITTQEGHVLPGDIFQKRAVLNVTSIVSLGLLFV